MTHVRSPLLMLHVDLNLVALTNTRRQHTTLGLLGLDIDVEHGFYTQPDLRKSLTVLLPNPS